MVSVMVMVLAAATSSGCKGCGGRPNEHAAADDKVARATAAQNVEGLAAIPAGAKVVIGADPHQLAASPLVRHAIASLRSHELDTLAERCKVDPGKDVDSVLVALMTTTTAHDVLLVAKGRFEEPAIVDCVRAQLAADGGSIVAKQVNGLTIYVVKNPSSSDVVLAFGAPGTLLVADSEPLLLKALDPAAPKVAGDQDAMARIARTDTRAAMWGAAVIDPEVGKGLIAAAGGKITAPAKAIWGHAKLDSGLEVELALQMASAADATAAAEIAAQQVTSYAVLAQGYGLGSLVNKIHTVAHGDQFVLSLSLDASELAKVEAMVDKSHSTSAEEGKGTSP